MFFYEFRHSNQQEILSKSIKTADAKGLVPVISLQESSRDVSCYQSLMFASASTWFSMSSGRAGKKSMPVIRSTWSTEL